MIPGEIKKKIAERPCDTLYGYELALEEIAQLKEGLDAAREDEAIRFNSWLADNYDFFEFGEPGKRWGKFWEDEEAGTEGFDVIEMPTLYQLYKKQNP